MVALNFVLGRFRAASAVRPFAAESLMLSLCEPSTRCSGRQHGGLSHLCNTNLPRGMGPNILVHATIHRSEEHTSELQSRLHLVCRLLLEKKKKKEHYSLIHCLTRI